MEIDNVQVVKPFGPLILIAQLPEGVIKPLNEIVDVIKDRKDMGARLAGVIETESEIPHSMLEEKKVMNIFHALSRSYLRTSLFKFWFTKPFRTNRIKNSNAIYLVCISI